VSTATCCGIGVPSSGSLSKQRSPCPHASSGTDLPHCWHQILNKIIEYRIDSYKTTVIDTIFKDQEFLTLSNGTDRFSRNVGNESSVLAALTARKKAVLKGILSRQSLVDLFCQPCVLLNFNISVF